VFLNDYPTVTLAAQTYDFVKPGTKLGQSFAEFARMLDRSARHSACPSERPAGVSEIRLDRVSSSRFHWDLRPNR